jgi:transcriptional regulator with XRE-family HTH domain
MTIPEARTMTRRDPQTSPAAFLGDELRRARLAAGFSSQDALAAKLGFDRTVVTKAETGQRPPTVDVLVAWCQACRLPEELFTRLAELARRAQGPVPSWFEGWLEAGGDAHTLRLWAPVLLPGLLQTAEYARALFVAMGMDEDAVEQQVSVRLGRQDILGRSAPPQVVAVLYEAVLHHLVGTPQALHDALVYVAELSQRPNVSIQIVPVETGANAGMGGSFCIASGDGAPEVLLMETVEDVTTETRPLVRRAANIFVRVQADALPRAASRALILEAAQQWKAQ